MNFIEDLVIKKVYLATTDKGFTLKYEHHREDKIVYHNPNLQYDETMEQTSVDEQDILHPTLFKIECNFEINGEMLKRLHSSKIMHVVGFDNSKLPEKSFIKFQAKQMFSYNKLKAVLSEMCVHFGLQTPLDVIDDAQDDN